MTDTKSKVITLISELFSDKGFETSIVEYVDLIDDAGMDSITFISVVVEIEDKFDIVIPNEMIVMDNFRSVKDIVDLVEKLKK